MTFFYDAVPLCGFLMAKLQSSTTHSLFFYFKCLCFKHPLKSYILELFEQSLGKKIYVSFVSAIN